MSFNVQQNQNLRFFIFRIILGKRTFRQENYFFFIFFRILGENFESLSLNLSTWSSKLHSICPVEHFGGEKET